MSDRLPPPAVQLYTERRLIRVNTCPILEVTVTYPCLEEAEAPAAARFNQTYRDIAESFLAWAETAPAEEAESGFRAMGSAAPYRFDRRILTCDMTAAVREEPPILAVTRTVTLKSRRGELAEKSLGAYDLWRLPELTLITGKRRIRRLMGET